MPATRVTGFKPPETITFKTVSLPVYESKRGTIPLLVLHELPGMSKIFIDYCTRMADLGYKVYMPLMFKSPGTQMSKHSVIPFCLSREFRSLFCPQGPQRHQRPFTPWLQHVASTVVSRHPGHKVGVVGMCLTGGYSLAGLAVEGVDAAICCQPSIPFLFNLDTLGMTEQERDEIATRAATLPAPCAKGYRFKGDVISRDGHMCAAQSLLGEHFERYNDLTGNAHSTLTDTSASEAVFQDVLTFLNTRLRPLADPSLS